MRITLGIGVTRAGVDESITGLWSFANVLGLLTDIVGERTSASGVTVDGLLIQDAGIPEAAVTAHEAALAILESQITDGTILARLAAAEVVTGGWRFNSSVEMRATLEMNDFASAANAMLRSDVVGDSVERFALHVGGIMQWGDGFSARDTNLFRVANGELATDNDFNVGKTLDVAGMVEVSKQTTNLSAQADDFDISTFNIQRFTLTGGQSITGFNNGVNGAVIFISNADSADSLTLVHESASSVAANRINLGLTGNLVLVPGRSAMLYYDDFSSRWRSLSRE